MNSSFFPRFQLESHALRVRGLKPADRQLHLNFEKVARSTRAWIETLWLKETKY